jgi:hypothetical protein
MHVNALRTKWLSVILASAGLLLVTSGCRTTDKTIAICEQNNRTCHQSCADGNTSFNNSKTAFQIVSQCDIRCDKTYDGCLKRQQNKNVRVIDDTPNY